VGHETLDRGSSVAGPDDPHRRNRLLAGLPDEALDALRPALGIVPLERGRILQEPFEPVREVLFPHGGIVTVGAALGGSRIVAAAAVGAEGFLGFWALLGGQTALCRLTVRIPSTASRLPVDALKAAMAASPPLQAALLAQTKLTVGQTLLSSACCGLHSIEARCARWLLQVDDRLRPDEPGPTQGLLAELAGVQRQSIGAACAALRRRGLIGAEPGALRVADRAGLEAAACDCYRASREVAARVGAEAAGR